MFSLTYHQRRTQFSTESAGDSGKALHKHMEPKLALFKLNEARLQSDDVISLSYSNI